MKSHISFYIFIVLILCASCKKDGPLHPDEPAFISPGSNGVFVVNEGNFQFGNASVSYYQEGMDQSVEDLFEPANNRPLGDVGQVMHLFNGKAYVVINNSGKIEVVNPQTFVSEAIISGFNTPRDILPVSNNKAYVSDLYAGEVTVVDLSNHSISGSISLNSASAQMALVYGHAFITSTETNRLYVVNTLNDAVSDTVVVGFGANSIVQDKNGKLWVLCRGNFGNIASLHRVDPVNNSVEESFLFSNSSDAPNSLNINGGLDTLYFLNKDVYRMAIAENSLPTHPFVAGEGRNFYGLGVHPESGNIYVSDAIDYVQRGEVLIYRPDGSHKSSFLAGIIPSTFCFN